MITLPNYHIIQKIYESANSLVYRGIRTENNQPIILKVLKENFPTSAELTRYQQEYEIIRTFNNLSGVIKAYGIEKYQNTLVIILEDFGGNSLKQLLATHFFETGQLVIPSFEEEGQGISSFSKEFEGISIAEFLPLAIQIADSLGQIHANNIIHKDINPSNIVVNMDTHQLKIIDFGIASRLLHEQPTLKNPDTLEGTLAYISPEQTGRINRSIDYRTDLYSLGVTFYEMLTGQLPFDSSDSLQLVHCHIAKAPMSVCEINSDVPPVLSEIVVKLMAKNAEDRYQSAFGLKSDLEICLHNLESLENLQDFSLELAQNDFSGTFHIPQKLYGRYKEIDILLHAFERVANPPQSSMKKGQELILVAGYSGVGKSALVHEMHKPMTEKCGYFASGKFDQYQRNIPYFALTEALNEFCHYLLTESTEQLKQWRNKILTAIGSNGQILIDVIPSLELIIGSQPTVVQVGPQEAQNRFHLVFQNFMRAISQKEHPLILFIDDLQWADSASLTLLKTLMTNTDEQYFLIIGAYRDNEVDSSHPIMIMLENLQTEYKVSLHTIHLTNLSHFDVNALIADALKHEPTNTQILTNLIYEKTHGNAFFTHEFLKSLYKQALLIFNVKTQQWQWDIEQIALQDMTDNVVTLMANKIAQLSVPTQEVIKLAACIGNQFDLKTLAIIKELPQKETLARLWKAIEEGLLVPLDDNYKLLNQLETDAVDTHFKFQHDRVQQAAYSLIADTDKSKLHWQIGHLLLAHTEDLGERLFEIVDHFNLSQEQIEQPDKREEIIRLNLRAGQNAKAAAAYESASQYLNTALELLPNKAWQTHYELTLALYVETVETEYLNTHFERVETLSQIVLQQAKTVLDKVKIYENQILSHIAQNQMNPAIKIGLQALEMLEVSLVKTPPQNMSIEVLAKLPPMDEPSKQAAMRFLMNLLAPILIANPTQLPQIAFTMLNLCMNHGNSPVAAFAYVFYGLLLCGKQENIEKGYQSGQLALTVLEQFQVTEIKCKVHNLFYSFINHWKKPAKESIPFLLQTIQIGLETGDLEYASHAIVNYSTNIFLIGKPLESVSQKQRQYIDFLKEIKQEFNLHFTKIWGQLVLNLSDKVEYHKHFKGDLFDEEKMLLILQNNNNLSSLYALYLAKTINSYFLKDYPEAIANASIAVQYEQAVTGTMMVSQHPFYYSLALLAHYSTVSPPKQIEYLEQVVANQQKMKIWTEHAPMNYQHKYELVEAEKARILGQYWLAAELYEKAIDGARENEYLHEEALAYELVAEFYLGRNIERIARTYIIEAHYRYQQWGAMAKLTDLVKTYPQWLEYPLSQPISTTITSTATRIGSPKQKDWTVLDLDSVLKASQTLSGEMVLSKLLEKMMYIVIENAGAQRGFLILEKEGKGERKPEEESEWVIEAEGTIENNTVTILQSLPIENRLPMAIINYVIRTQESVVLGNAIGEGVYTDDNYIRYHQMKSLLCLPILHQNHLLGIFYLENNLTEDTFTPTRLQILTLLSSQIAISLENSRFVNELEHARQAAEVANHTKTAFLANVSHELRTPLHGILGFAQLLAEDNSLNIEQLEQIKIIQQCGNSLLTVIEDILEIAQLEIGKIKLYPNEFDLHPFLNEIAKMFQQHAKDKDLAFIYELSSFLPRRIYTDNKKLRQILLHLLSNAIKFTQNGGILFRVTTETLKMKQNSKFHLRKDVIHFQIADTGIGIATENLNKIFSPFEQVSHWTTKSDGAGLGLSIIKKILDVMEGELYIESTLGKGSTFSVALALPDVSHTNFTQTQIFQQYF